MEGTELESQIADATAAILLARFTTRPIPEICAMGGITLEDFSQSVAYKEIFGLGEERGREQGLEQGLKTGELEITLRQLRRRCGGLSASQEACIRALALPQLEALAEALLDFQGADDLEAWLSAGGSRASPPCRLGAFPGSFTWDCVSLPDPTSV